MEDKQILLKTLEEVLKTSTRFVSSEGDLLKNVIREKALKLDENLISLLLENEVLKAKFFKEISEITIFDNPTFIQFLNNKEFLPSSYTSFKNKVGLTNEKGDFLSNSNEVVLSFPFKDCVLAGGQDKEDSKREEVFYNEILGSDEIDVLFDKKVFTNFRKIDKDGEHKIDEFKRDKDGLIKDNLIIKGNNLLALHSLKSNFVGKVKLIYIDPPYNTGNDGFRYNDNFNHSTRLVFMKNRLEIARELLRDDGVIFVQCDDNEQAYLKVLMDEIFGRKNFVNKINWERSAVAGLGLGGKIINVSEYILVYSKNFSTDFIKGDMCREIEYDKKDFFYYKVLKNHGKRELVKKFISSSGSPIKIYKHTDYNISKINENSFDKDFKNMFRTFLIQKENSFQQGLIREMINKSLYSVEYIPNRGKNKGGNICNFYYNGELFSWLKDLARIEDNKVVKKEKLNNFWDRKFISNASRGEGGIKGLDRMKKPEKLLNYIIEMSTAPGDLVLDYHLGSGTTCAVAHKMGRQYIGVEQMDYIETISVERMKKVIEGEQGGISKNVNWKGGGEFVYMELSKQNQNYFDRIQEIKDKTELVKLWNKIKNSEFVNYYVNIEEIDKNIKEFENLSIEDMRKFLVEILDKNLLYKNYSEMNDEKIGVNEEDKRLNNSFYDKN